MFSMRSPLKLSALLALLLLALSLVGGTGVGAQDDAEEFDVNDLEGIQHGVGRSYSIDYSAMMDQMSTPGAEMAMPTGIVGIGALILEFDGNDNAQAAFDKLMEQAMAEDTFGDDTEVEEVDLGLGEQSNSYAGTYEIDGQESEDVITVVRQDTYVYVVYASGADTDVQSVVSDFTTGLIETGGSGEGEFHEDGTSTGGLWDKFPAADDELVADLIAYDQVIFPVPEGTPAA